MSAYKGSIPRAFIEQLLNQVDIVQVINQRVPLKKAGSNYKACCPFHAEKTPSFNVSPQKQFYHCFGCGASGDALKFLMEYDGLSFVDAVETLAGQYGLEVPYEKSTRNPEAVKKQQDLYDVTHRVAKFYRHQLRDHPQAEQAKAYLRQRGLTPEVAKHYVIGFAPGKNLLQSLKADPFLQQQLLEVGVLGKGEDGQVYERFRQRIMFPIRDVRGRVIAFGGRILGDGMPKYLNSPETPIFSKSRTLYGLYELKQSRQKFEYIIVVEGYMDVVALAQFGVQNAVATLGTATTEEHLQMLFQQVSEVVFCFDGDAAGLKAAWKALEISLPFMTQERSVKFLFLPEGEDPDSMVRKEGAEGFQQRVRGAYALSQFLLEGLQGQLKAPLETVEGRQHLVALAAPYVQKAQGLYQFLLAEGVANLVHLPTWRVEKEMGVRSGFAQVRSSSASAPASQTNFNQGRAVNSGYFPSLGGQAGVTLPKVPSLPFKLIAILLRQPVWAKVFYPEFLAALQGVEARDVQLLSQVIAGLQQHGQVAPIKVWLQQRVGAPVLNYVEGLSLPESEEGLKKEFEALIARLALKVSKTQIAQQGLSKQALAQLQVLYQT